MTGRENYSNDDGNKYDPSRVRDVENSLVQPKFRLAAKIQDFFFSAVAALLRSSVSK